MSAPTVNGQAPAIKSTPTAPIDGSTRHNLATPGAWVELRDFKTVTGRHRKAVMSKLMEHVSMVDGKVVSPSAAVAMVGAMDVADLVAALLVTAWHIPYMPDAPLPAEDPDLIPDLWAPDYDIVTKLVAPAVAALMPSRVDPSDFDKPDSPSGPASG